MPNIIKISDINVYIGVTNPTALQETFDCKAVLDQNGIVYNNLIYPTVSQYASVFENLSTWVFGLDFTQYTFTDFPIITWREYYDTYEICDQVVTSVSQLNASTLIANKELIV